ncbi:hypothetical protein A2392_01160 [Candidatus Kaiserbacteria bacterium RIFOXYB1_FULL_46_14]|uniref:RlpA-like protein double-psi beta-barrel domain-containing protein n=1 Tax=Candidatus Kaiserbacteria bacterium RIFOXYB1_FULL_46_14 TaxID=1798531 RepID=A0A1F6FJM2_9BACT|nr:MAG: hypothetical protein A2392_01160 [Candidatus Kaiserbacteria bacterium RIFOXYB1_FULL_46_14]
MKKTYVVVMAAISYLALTTTTYARVETCMASWYGPGFNGRLMANGRPFNQDNPNLAAHKSLPFGTKLVITNLNNGKTHKTTVTDRGPYVKGRCVDVSRAGAIKLGFISRGHTRVRVQIVK